MEALNIAIAVLLLLSAAAGAWLTRINQRQAQRIVELEEANLENWHAAWVACEEHMRATPLVAQAHDAAMVELLGVVVDSRTTVERGELSELRRSGELGQVSKELTVG